MTRLFFLTNNAASRACILACLWLLSLAVYAQDLQKCIPATASGVVTLDGSNFFRKIDLDQINRLEMFKELDEETRGRKGSKYDEYSKIYKNPSSIGLNVLSKSYLYFEHSPDTTSWGTHYTYSALLVGLSKSKKFESFIKKVSDEPIQKSGVYKYVHNSRSNIVAWNNSQVIVLWLDGYYEEKDSMLLKEFERITHLSPEQCIKSNKNFIESQSAKFDFNYWMNFESFFSGLWFSGAMTFPVIKALPFIGSDFYKGYYLQLFLNFNNGSVSFNSKQLLSEESARKVEHVYGSGINPGLLNYIHKDHLLGIYSYSLNMEGIKAMLDTALHDTVKSRVNEAFIDFLYRKKINDDPKVVAMNKQLDSMYTDLYDYNHGDDSDEADDTTAISPAYDDYTDEPYRDSIPEEDFYGYYEEDTLSVPVDTAVYDTSPIVFEEEDYATVDSSVSDTTDFSANITSFKRGGPDSLFQAKRARVDSVRTLISKRKQQLSDEKVKELALENNDLLEIFQGDIMGAITDYFFIEKKYKTYDYDEEELQTVEVEKTKREVFPEYVIGLTLNNVGKAKNILEKLHQDSFLLRKDNYYYFPFGDQSVMTMIAGKILLITNNKELLSRHAEGYQEAERLPKNLQDLLLNKNASAYVSLKDIFARLPFNNLSRQRHDIYTLLMNSLGSISLTSFNYKSNVSDSEIVFNVTNKLDNSFYEILRIINEAYKINKAQY